MKIKTAKFLMSNSMVSSCPDAKIPEYAFIGRSNVGKSSLINMLTNNKKLAKTSGTPGKTQLINHFLINENWYLVDLPGYGYAKVSKVQKRKFQKFIIDYFEQRKQLVNAFVLVDIRHEPQKIDREFMEYLGMAGIPFSIIFTKADKLKPAAIERNVEDYLNTLREGIWAEVPPHFVTSSANGNGREEVLNYIEEINEDVRK